MNNTKNNIQISFIIPSYNCEATLVEAVESILALGLQFYEICLVDDGSTDSTWVILERYQKLYPEKVKIGKNQKNLGGAITRNECVKLSTYPYIFCLDSDNYLDVSTFNNFIKHINKDDHIISFGNISFFANVGPLKISYKSWHFLPDEMRFDDLRKTNANPVASSNHLFTREMYDLMGGYDTDLGALDNFSLGYKALVKGYKIKLVKNTTIHYRLHPNSYWVRENNTNNENFRKLLLRYPDRFSLEETQRLKEVSDVGEVFYNKQNDFSKVDFKPVFKLVSWVHNKFFTRK